MQYATWLQDQTMLTKITAVESTSKEAKNHGVCRVKYQTETESTLEGRKESLNVTFPHSHSVWHKEKFMLKCLMLLIFTLKVEFWITPKFIYLSILIVLSGTFARHCKFRFETHYQLKVHLCRSENLLTCSSLHKNNVRRYHIITPFTF